MRIHVKICGITNLPDALAAVEAGADALGFMCYERSKRFVATDLVASIARELPPFVFRVGVFVNAPEEAVRRAVEECGINALQFHGEETPEFCARFSLPVIKAFQLSDHKSLAPLERFQTNAWLLDAAAPGQRGGTGQSFDWSLAIEARRFGRPIILAGGLTPDNVAEAVRRVLPYGVDVSSGVELSPGRKDHTKIASFVNAARTGGR
ncbi:MAG: phosphoribosylanthranilate isomerase [Verrucomicrobia subdivision 3 bacterium]|nr:phosphoribosylanthranilate isomerase [Limisphaerales bacterium]